MSQHANARLAADSPFDFVGDNIPDAAQTCLPSVLSTLGRNDFAIGQLGSFRDHDQREFLPLLIAFQDLAADILEGPWNLWDQDHVATTRDSRVQANPAGMSAHHFQHQHAFVAGSGCVQAIERVRRTRDGAIESERERGRR